MTEGAIPEITPQIMAIIQDVLDSVHLACVSYDQGVNANPGGPTVDEIYHAVNDYVGNTYGDC